MSERQIAKQVNHAAKKQTHFENTEQREEVTREESVRCGGEVRASETVLRSQTSA